MPRSNTTLLGTGPKLDQSPTNNGVQSHTATSIIPSGSITKLSPCITGTNPLCALWAYLLSFVNRMARTISPLCIEWLEQRLASHPKPTLNQPKMECNMLPTLHGASGGRYEVVPHMAPKTVTFGPRHFFIIENGLR